MYAREQKDMFALWIKAYWGNSKWGDSSGNYTRWQKIMDVWLFLLFFYAYGGNDFDELAIPLIFVHESD